MKNFLFMLSFFSRIPVRARFEPDAAGFSKGIKYLFLIALIIGVGTGGAFVLGRLAGPYFAALVSLVVYLGLTGGLHIDGLADTMDAIGSRRDRQRMLDIMKDSHVGTFGVLAVCVYIAGMVIFAVQLPYIVIGLYPLVGRTAALLIARTNGCARQGGLGSSFIDGVRTRHVTASALVFLLIAAAVGVDAADMTFDAARAAVLAVPYVLSLTVIAIIARGISKKLGGITGDVIGFGIEAASWTYLLFACVAVNIV